ncbi:MAG: hypothetical protein HQ539_02645 [Parcubacteria group bacterium]|nr:hypothetical protein [Parcubacteria group bacterium]
MEKYSNLSFVKQKELLRDFCSALLTLQTEEEAVNFLVDLLTKEEVIKLAKRIKIAQLLLQGNKYRKIVETLNVSQATVAKVALWLKEGGDGFKLIFKREKKRSNKIEPGENFGLAINEWKRFKKRYPSMFWPSLLVEGIINSADKKEKEKFKKVFEKLDHRSKIYKEVNEIFKR